MNGRLEKENKLKNQIEEKLRSLPPIFNDFYNYLEADHKSYITIKHYIEYVSDFRDAVAKNGSDEFYKNITVSQLRAYIVGLRRRIENGKEVNNSVGSQAVRWSALNTFFSFLVWDEYIDINPMSKTKRPKDRTERPVVYLEKDEIDCIIGKIREESKPQLVNRDLSIVMLGIGTGIRVGALTQINISDIDFKNNTIHVIEKGNKDRYLSFGSNVRNVLSEWLLDRQTYFPETETDALFISQWRQRITTEGVRKLLKRYADGINGKHITPHKMRSSAATNMAKSGVDIQTIANILGHQSVTTTQRYAAVLEENKQKATDALDNMF